MYVCTCLCSSRIDFGNFRLISLRFGTGFLIRFAVLHPCRQRLDKLLGHLIMRAMSVQQTIDEIFADENIKK